MNAPASRRGVILGLSATALTGVVVGSPVYRATGPDLTAVAEAWLEDARDLGICLTVGPDGNVWQTVPICCDAARDAAIEAHLVRLGDRPRLMRAVRRRVEAGFQPWEGRL